VKGSATRKPRDVRARRQAINLRLPVEAMNWVEKEARAHGRALCAEVEELLWIGIRYRVAHPLPWEESAPLPWQQQEVEHADTPTAAETEPPRADDRPNGSAASEADADDSEAAAAAG
jgi:hypothetical protein